MNVITYSERGLVDSLVYSLNEDTAKDLLIKAFPYQEGKEISDITFYLEQSLSEFGNPDLIISYKYDKKDTIVFVEAKVSNQKKWTLQQQYELFKNDVNSNFFWQIALKQLLIENRNLNETELMLNGVSSFNPHIMRKRGKIRLGSNPVVYKLFCKIIKNAQEILYLGIVPQKEKIVFHDCDKKNFDKINYLSWKEIEEFAYEKGLDKLIENFKWNEGLIYND